MVLMERLRLFNVEVFGLLRRPLDREHLERSDLRQYIDEAGVHVEAEAGLLAICLPVIICRSLQQIVPKIVQIGARNIRREALLMQKGLGGGNVGNKTAHPGAVGAYGLLFAPDDVRKVDPVSFKERLVKKRPWNFETYELEIRVRSKPPLAELVDVEGKLSLHMRMWILSVVDDRAILLLKLRKLDRHSMVHSSTVTNSVANVMRQRPNSKGQLIGGMSIAQQTQHKVTRPNVVSKVREERVAEGIVSEVLNRTATIRIGVRLLKLRLSKRRILLQ